MTDQTEPIRKSILPATPPPEYEVSTVFGSPHGCTLVPSDAGDIVVRRLVTYGDWEPVRPDRWADEPETGPSAPAVPLSADHTALRDRIAAALAREDAHNAGYDHGFVASYGADDETDGFVDAVLAVLPAPTSQTAEPPLSPYYSHEACGLHWHGRDDMDIPMRDGQPVCPRCELAKAEKKLAALQRRRDEIGVECKRRGKRVLEQSEQIRALEQQIDEVRRQLGEEILRAGQAEAELRRLADETPHTQTQAHEPLHQWRVEILDGDEWMPASGLRRDRAQVVEQLRMSSEKRPLWNDGTPVQRRLVRETTTYTVEQPAAGARPTHTDTTTEENR